MRMRRLLTVSALALAAVFVATPATAAPPGSGCPTGFSLEPVSILGDNFSGVADNVNHDGMICVKFLKSGSGTFTDNVVP